MSKCRWTIQLIASGDGVGRGDTTRIQSLGTLADEVFHSLNFKSVAAIGLCLSLHLWGR